MPEDQEVDPDLEELTISQAAREFKINRKSLNVWVHSKKIPARKETSELGMEYWLVKRGDVAKFLTRPKKPGRPLKRT